MGLRFGKRIRLGKFIHLNISRSGLGVSAGVPGARLTLGPRGTWVNTGIPGSGLSYRQKIDSIPALPGLASLTGGKDAPQSPETLQQLALPEKLRVPLLASVHEKNFVKGLNAFRVGQIKPALKQLLAAAPLEPSAAIIAAFILVHQGEQNRALELLEGVIQGDQEFPTALTLKYLPEARLPLDITPHVSAAVPLDGLGAALGLVELYQAGGRIEEAIGLLEEIEELADEPVITLSLCELYAAQGLWDGIIDCAAGTASEDDVTLETMVIYGRALQEQELYTAAIDVFTNALRHKKDRNPVLLNEARYWRAVSYQASGKARRAREEFEKVLANDPGFRDVRERVKAQK